jgi:hypothetical protein
MADGSSSWKVYRFNLTGWSEETDPNWWPPFPPDTDPEAVREVQFDGPSSSCTGLIVASAKTGQHIAVLPKGSTLGGSNWVSVDEKRPTFDLVDASGRPSRAFVAKLSRGYDGIVANTIMQDGSVVSFAYTQDSAGWHANPLFVPDAALDSLDSSKPVFSFIGPIAGESGDDVAILNDQRVTTSDSVDRNRQFGTFYTNDGSGFQIQVHLPRRSSSPRLTK